MISSGARLPHRHSWRFINSRCQALGLKQIWRISFAMINHQRHGNLAFLLHPTLGRRWLIGATASGWINFSCSSRKSGKVTRHALQHQSQLCADRASSLPKSLPLVNNKLPARTFNYIDGNKLHVIVCWWHDEWMAWALFLEAPSRYHFSSALRWKQINKSSS